MMMTNAKMTEAEVRIFAEKKLKEWGLDGWGVYINRRTKRRLGKCDYRNKRIEVSASNIACNSEDSVKDTVLHEIAHALAGHRAGHGPEWKKWAKKVGANPKATATTKEAPAPKYVVVIKGEPKVYKRYHRKPSQQEIAKLQRSYIPGRDDSKGNLRVEAYNPNYHVI